MPTAPLVVGDVRPEGGYQDPKAWADATATLIASRAAPQCLFADDFMALLREHLHPRFCSVGVACHEPTQALRAAAGIGRSGTLWVATATQREEQFVVPMNCLPFTSIRPAEGEWDPDLLRFSREPVKGWRKSLGDLVRTGKLKASDALSWLIGEDCFKIQPQHFRA